MKYGYKKKLKTCCWDCYRPMKVKIRLPRKFNISWETFHVNHYIAHNGAFLSGAP